MAQISLYELMHGSLSVTARQHLVYHFSGKGHENGKNWYASGDGTDTWSSEGVTITPSSSRGEFGFGDKRQYDRKASNIVWVSRLEFNTGGSMYNGGFYDQDSPGVDQHGWFIHGTGVALMTADASQNFTNTSDDGGSSVFADKFNVYRTESLRSSCNGHINGLLNATKTNNLSRQNFQPAMFVYNGSAGHAKYVEAWNT